MENSVLINILKTIEKRQHNSLISFAESSFFNEKKDVIVFINTLLDFYPFGENSDFTKEICYLRVYPETKYNDSKMRQLMSATKKVLENYIVTQHIQNNGSLKNSILIDYYDQKEKPSLLNPKIKTQEKNIAQIKQIDEKYFYEEFKLAEKKVSILSTQGAINRNKNFRHDFQNQMMQTTELLNKYYFIQVLNFYLQRYAQSVLFDDTIELGFVEHILEEVFKNDKYSDTIPINMYAHTITFLRDKDKEEHFFKLKELLEQNAHKTNYIIASNLYRMACSYSINQIHDGKKPYYQTLFELYNTMLDQKLILVNGYMPIGTFKNIVNLSLRLNKYDWVEKFIYTNTKKIAGENSKDILNFVLALLKFNKKEFGNALDLLNKIHAINDIYYKIESKVLFLKVFYELEEIDLLYSQMTAFKTFIHRDKLISKLQKNRNKNFINILMRIVELNPQEEKKRLKLMKSIASSRELIEQDWLMEKLEQTQKQTI